MWYTWASVGWKDGQDRHHTLYIQKLYNSLTTTHIRHGDDGGASKISDAWCGKYTNIYLSILTYVHIYAHHTSERYINTPIQRRRRRLELLLSSLRCLSRAVIISWWVLLNTDSSQLVVFGSIKVVPITHEFLVGLFVCWSVPQFWWRGLVSCEELILPAARLPIMDDSRLLVSQLILYCCVDCGVLFFSLRYMFVWSCSLIQLIE